MCHLMLTRGTTLQTGPKESIPVLDTAGFSMFRGRAAFRDETDHAVRNTRSHARTPYENVWQ